MTLAQMIFAFVLLILFAGAIPLFIQGGNAERVEIDRRPRTHVERDTHPGLRNIVVTSDAGDLRVGGGPDGAILTACVLRWTGEERPEVITDVDGDTLRITVRCPETGEGEEVAADVMVTLPVGGSVEATLRAGDVSLDGLAGEQRVRTASGDVRATALRAAWVEASTGAGEITLRFAAAPRHVEVSGAGDVQVVLPDGEVYAVDGEAEVGDVVVTVRSEDDAPRTVRARTSAGDVLVVADV